MEKLVTIATFDYPTEADTGKLFLEQDGIRAFLADDNLVGMNWSYSNAVGGVKLQVAVSDVDRANEILEQFCVPKAETSEEHPEGDVTFACHDCGKRITVSRERCGLVETCPHCGNYVDVPDDAESSPPLEPKTTASPMATALAGTELSKR